MDNPPPYSPLQPSAPPPTNHYTDERAGLISSEVKSNCNRPLKGFLLVLIPLTTCLAMVTYNTVRTSSIMDRLDALDAGGEWPNLAIHVNNLDRKLRKMESVVGQFDIRQGVLTGEWRELSKIVGNIEEFNSEMERKIQQNVAEILNLNDAVNEHKIEMKTLGDIQKNILEKLSAIEYKPNQMTNETNMPWASVIFTLISCVFVLINSI